MMPQDQFWIVDGDETAEGSASYPDHLLVWSLRRIAHGRAECPVMAREFADACGEDADEVFLTFCTFLRALGYASRRKLAIGMPGSLIVTPDERQIVTLIAAVQADRPALFEANISWLSDPERRHLLRIAVGALATALTAHDLRLALPASDEPTVCQRPRAVA